MRTNTIIYTILWWLLLVACCWLVLAQSQIDKQNEIIELDEQISQLEYEIHVHQTWYKISVEASKECEKSFLDDAEKEHIEADKKRELIEKLKEKKEGLMKNR